MDYAALAPRIKSWGLELGFQAVGIADADLSAAEPRLLEWLGQGWHGEMEYMARHAALRARPAELKPGTLRVISCRMDYLNDASQAIASDPECAVIARYARGRDYHKLLRNRLQALCGRIEQAIGPFGYRVFSDSAPVMEVELAARTGIGWRGKHTLLLSRDAGSWFFLGEVYTDLALPLDSPAEEHCGSCQKCIDVCPTQAIRAPYQLDARRCISYLTIEHGGEFSQAQQPLLGDWLFGCDVCQDVCPWNVKFALPTHDVELNVRPEVAEPELAALLDAKPDAFQRRFGDTPFERPGVAGMRRNAAAVLANHRRAHA